MFWMNRKNAGNATYQLKRQRDTDKEAPGWYNGGKGWEAEEN